MERSRTCCFIGHRKLPRGSNKYIFPRVTAGIRYLHDRGYTDFIVGGTVGFDTFVARILTCEKVMGYDMKLHLFLPCKDQTVFLSGTEQIAYREILHATDDITYISDTDHPGCIEQRNQAMVDASSACIAYITDLQSEEAQTLHMAKQAGLEVFNVGPEIAQHFMK